MGWQYCGSEICLKTVLALDLPVLSFSRELGQSLLTAKLTSFDLKIKTAVNRYGIVGSSQSVGQDKVGFGFELGCSFFSHCFCVWRSMLLANQAVLQSNFTSNETDYKITLQVDEASDGGVVDRKGVSNLVWKEAAVWIARIEGNLEQVERVGTVDDSIMTVWADGLF